MYVTIEADVPLSRMFGFSTDLRSSTQVSSAQLREGSDLTCMLQGKGEFTMEYKEHQPVLPDMKASLMKKYQEELAASRK